MNIFIRNIIYPMQFTLDECLVDDDCPLSKACHDTHCIDPCTLKDCAQGADCRVNYHKAQCFCPPGYQGNPLVSCTPFGCQSHDDCATDEVCDFASQTCRPLCQSTNPCVQGAKCEAYNHIETCTCIPPLVGNGHIYCEESRSSMNCQHENEVRLPYLLLLLAYEPPQPECRIDQDCGHQLSCIQESCQNPCQVSNPCQGNMICSVEEAYNGKKTVACSCPDGFVAVSSSSCEKGII